MTRPFDLDEAKRICEAATPGPWEPTTKVGDGVISLIPMAEGLVNGADDIAYYGGLLICESCAQRNRDFIAYARTALPAAIEEIKALQDKLIWAGCEIGRLRARLGFSGDRVLADEAYAPRIASVSAGSGTTRATE